MVWWSSLSKCSDLFPDFAWAIAVENLWKTCLRSNILTPGHELFYIWSQMQL